MSQVPLATYVFIIFFAICLLQTPSAASLLLLACMQQSLTRLAALPYVIHSCEVRQHFHSMFMQRAPLQVYGQDFVHGGDHIRSRPPPYLDPFDLLDAPTVDPMVPLR